MSKDTAKCYYCGEDTPISELITSTYSDTSAGDKIVKLCKGCKDGTSEKVKNQNKT